MKLVQKLLYYCFIALLVIVLPDSIKGFALLIVIIVWVSKFFISDKTKERMRKMEVEKQNYDAYIEKVRWHQTYGYPDENENSVNTTAENDDEDKYKFIFIDERPGAVKSYDEYLQELSNNDTKNIQGSYDEYVEELSMPNPSQNATNNVSEVRNIEDPYEDYNSAVDFSDGYNEDNDRGPDPIDDDNDDEEGENTTKSSLDLDDESSNENWSTYDDEKKIEQDPAYELRQKEYRQGLRSYRGFDTNFSVGESIEHHKFGKGTILSITKNIAAIHFMNWGIKKIDISVAPIKKIGF